MEISLVDEQQQHHDHENFQKAIILYGTVQECCDFHGNNLMKFSPKLIGQQDGNFFLISLLFKTMRTLTFA